MNDTFDDSPDARTVRRLRKVMAVFTGLLVASTWPLWTPGTEFPDVPWFDWAVRWPPEDWDWLWLASLGGLLAVQFVPLPTGRRWPTVLQRVLLAGAVMLLPTDQHRLQPWAWQMLLWAVFIGVSQRPRLALQVVRWMTLSLYVWSAVSKFDAAFFQAHGQLLLDGLTSSVGLSTEMWSEGVREGIAVAFPAGELAAALLLAIPRTRRVGLVGAVSMHVCLMLTLGPLGLGHEWGVFVWNAYFIVQNLLVFGTARPTGVPDVPIPSCPNTRLTRLAAIIACILPAYSLVGLWDWWPSWAVYSSRPAVVRLLVNESDLEKLPKSLRPHVGPPEPLSSWCEANLDAWSYDVCRCPMYPQARYRLAVVTAVVGKPNLEARIIVRTSPDRRSGTRDEFELEPLELRWRLQYFRLNTSPRKHTGRLPVD